MRFLTIRDFDYRGKRVLVREDLNVPLEGGKIADETRLVAALGTLKALREAGARTIVCSHLGRPDGKPDPKLSLRPIGDRLAELLGSPVAFVEESIGPQVRAASENLADGAFLLLENVRFHPEEERNDPQFAKELARCAERYVNDAFGTAHRAHASTEGVAHLLPAAAGLLMEAELAALASLTEEPQHPYVCAIGGAKIADKIGVFKHLMMKVDTFCIGGGMGNTFLAAKGVDVGKSLRDADLAPAKEILALAETRRVNVLLPGDAVVAKALEDEAHAAEVILVEPLGDRMILDIGEATAGVYGETIRKARTVVFNGPMGVYERAAYREGTRVVGEALVEATRMGATTVVGGGDAAAAAKMLGFAHGVSHVSTGGGATLEFLEGKTLPGIAALEAAAAASAAQTS
ncbi:MAG: phosphoglycerate kinase [Candidatus Eremiobacteraeota bacterium]|nr:phosphoglycerate kinase [Candidatus Eremiobacteraeota bacterium]